MLTCKRCGAPLVPHENGGFIEVDGSIYSDSAWQRDCLHCGTPYSPYVKYSGFTARMGRGLSPRLIKEILSELLENLCSQQDINSVFADTRLTPWKYTIPEAGNARSRANALIAHLCDKANTHGENALGLFLEAAGDAIDSNELRRLADGVYKEKRPSRVVTNVTRGT